MSQTIQLGHLFFIGAVADSLVQYGIMKWF